MRYISPDLVCILLILLHLHLDFVYTYDIVSQLIYKKLHNTVFSFLYKELLSLISEMEIL